MARQKFRKNDLVRIKKDLGTHKSHFTNDRLAIVGYSYRERYGHGDSDTYSIFIQGEGDVAWYDESDLILIERGRADLKKQWKADLQKEYEEKSNLDWIFKHGKEIANGTSLHGATIEALASCLHVDNLWGMHGEGIDYYFNALTVFEIAKPYLLKEDKEEWLRYCKKAQEESIR
jgi:hypothetical protein